ncbi:glycosyltransferase family 4 protein [Mammaliicoccus sciuri]|uniref:glycosyltransferase family 4 protein n=1 Tax=Mammaliicoccus sciuri TaxID=1296 RepID=UPI001951E20D|nr:glycosyltransferase family 4 protein [Mammaliicoccus sciuri]
MKVVHINSDYGNTIYRSLSKELDNFDIQQRVFKFTRPNANKNEQYDDFVDKRINYKNYERYIFHLKHYKVIKDFLEFYENDPIDLIHAHTLFSNGYVAYNVYKKRKIPYVVTVRGTDISVFLKYMKHLKPTAIKILLNSKKVIFLSHAHKTMLIEKYLPAKYRNTIEEKSVVIPNGIDNFYFKNINNEKPIKPITNITIITVAWINKNKNQHNTCKAISILNKKGYNITYRIIGGLENEKNKKLVKKIKNYDFVKLIPRKNKKELLEEYRNADITCMVSYKETFGLTYIESLLQRKPIIYSEKRGVDGYFSKNEIGYSANPSSPKDIANKIEKILENYVKLSNNTRLYDNEFRWDTIAEQIYMIYKS